MKLLMASFENFRLLKDVEINFSTDETRNITVIRAANKSGKTTMLTALQWGLFGDRALPGNGKDYRLHPIDSPTAVGTNVDISVTIEFQVSSPRGPIRYRLVRSATEQISETGWERRNPTLRLYEIGRKGSQPVENAEAVVRQHLPEELREVFFTDGDRALGFIQGSRNDQEKKVEGAIRSLLGLNVIEETIKHVKLVARELNARTREIPGSSERQTVSARIAEIQNQIPALEQEFKIFKERRAELSDLEKDAEKLLLDALSKGNKDELVKELEKVRQEWLRSEKDANQADRDHSNLFRVPSIAKQLLNPMLDRARNILDGLRDAKRIPNQTIPVLEERLQQADCICGESLDQNDPDGLKRREHIISLIQRSRQSDALNERVTALYFGSKELLTPVEGRGWLDEYSQVFARRQRSQGQLRDLGERERNIEAKIAALPDVNIRQLREKKETYRSQYEAADRDLMKCETKLTSLKEELVLRDVEMSKLLQADEKGAKIASELTVVHDLQGVMESALELMKTKELELVSKNMNTMFLDMIGADADQRSIIQKAAVMPDFRIVINGMHGRVLDPSQDLNGASRRALTIAFILALTKVSEVDAPNVIDTPLGMMSGYVKRSVLRIAAEQSAQLVLFLTHSEIDGCEDILDEKAGAVVTLTNPAHYPRILVNDPGTSEAKVIVCKCNHRTHCNICERREDAESTLKVGKVA